MTEKSTVVDTNVFVAAGFRPKSYSAEIVRRIQSGTWHLVWNVDTRRETRHTVGRIPVLSNRVLENVFRHENLYDAELSEEDFKYVSDPADRKFAALAVAAGVSLITSDDHLLTWRKRIPAPVLTPGQFMRLHG